MISWDELVTLARQQLLDRQLDHKYESRLEFEVSEIQKQGAEAYWCDIFAKHQRFSDNPNRLLLPYLLGLVENDPLVGKPLLNTVNYAAVKKYQSEMGADPPGFIKDPDLPDIDLDCLPQARDPIKEYARQKYSLDSDTSYGPVCSVGTWQTYKFKSAIMDVSRALGAVHQSEVYELTTKLPEDVDGLVDGGYANCKNKIIQDGECGCYHNLDLCPTCGSQDTDSPTIGRLLSEHQNLREFANKYPDVIEYAVKLVGRIRQMGMHAGALIIADRDLYGNIPMAKSSKDHWISMWTEGRNPQLSKFGYCKFDILGLKTLEYIFKCCKFIELNRGLTFGARVGGYSLGDGPIMSGWDDIDPLANRAGHFYDDSGNKHEIELNDPGALDLADRQLSDGVFQFDTSLAKSILANGVRNFRDLLLFNSLGHPGPMQSIPEAVQNRDDRHQSWRKRLEDIHPVLLEVLEDTYGVLCFQEQLASIWQRLGRFTATEAQEARKAVAKKWTHKLKPIEQKWLSGSSQAIGEEKAKYFWTKMETFGRYAFNRCLSGDTQLTDQLTGLTQTVDEWYASDLRPYLRSWNQEQVQVDECRDIHFTGEQEVFEITFSNGQTEHVTLEHKFLCSDGQFRTVRDIIDHDYELIDAFAQIYR